MITIETRAHLMAAGDDVFRAGDGHPNVDLQLVAAHIDFALRAMCPHLPLTWKTQPDKQGRDLTTCYACGMSWYNHDLPDQESFAVMQQRDAYMASLEKRLQSRAQEHGFAYVTPVEAERLQANGLYQPGHTIHRFSTATEDRSDEALEAQDALEPEDVVVDKRESRRLGVDAKIFDPRVPVEPRGAGSRRYPR